MIELRLFASHLLLFQILRQILEKADALLWDNASPEKSCAGLMLVPTELKDGSLPQMDLVYAGSEATNQYEVILVSTALS